MVIVLSSAKYKFCTNSCNMSCKTLSLLHLLLWQKCVNIGYFVNRGICISSVITKYLSVSKTKITHPRYGSPYPWPLNRILAYQKQWEIRRKMKAIGWAGKSLEQVSMKGEADLFATFSSFI